MSRAPIDHHVATVMESVRRQRSGSRTWDQTIDVKGIIERDPENETEEHAAVVGNEIAALLRAEVDPKFLDFGNEAYDSDLAEIIEDLEDFTPDAFAKNPDYTVFGVLNSRLSELYDWADQNRIFLGDGTPSPAPAGAPGL